jgi:hypothetical protein
VSEPTPPPLRIGNADREDAAAVLAEHFSHGRLDGEEYEERVATAWAARTIEELRGVFADLPAPFPRVLREAARPAPDGLIPTGFADAGFAPPGFGQPGFAQPGFGQTGFPTGGLPSGGFGAGEFGAGGFGAAGFGAGPTAAYGPPAGLSGDPQRTGYPRWSAPYAESYAAPYPSGLPRPPLPAQRGPGLPMSTWDTDAPFGRDPRTGAPYSDKSKVTAGVLQLALGFAGIGRFYTGHVGIGLAQMLVTILTFGLGAAWGFVDGVLMLAGDPTDPQGRPLRP